jgi:two-component sensor histidine kinase
MNIGNIEIELTSTTDSKIRLIYKDNGQGFDPSKIKAGSFGINLVTLLVSQLHGTIQFTSKKGVCFDISIP